MMSVLDQSSTEPSRADIIIPLGTNHGESSEEPHGTQSNDSRNGMEVVADVDYVHNSVDTSGSTGANYDMVATESSGDTHSYYDGTIDAAAVEEIIDEDFLPSQPLSSSPPPLNSAFAALPVVATNVIPEVEPEVDIEEVHIHHDASHISTVSALTTTSVYTNDAMDSKLPFTTPLATEATSPRYSPIPSPPLVPQRQAIIPEYRGFSAGTATTSAAVMMVNHVGNNTAAMETTPAAAEPMEYAMSQTVAQSDGLPDYKDQSRPRIPSGSPLSSRNASNNTNNTGSSNQSSHLHPYSSHHPSSGALDVDDEHIPVVDAILVPAERLAAEEQAIQQMRHSSENMAASDRHSANSGNSSGSSTLSTSRSSSNNASDGNNSSNHNSSAHNGENASRSKSSENANLSGRPISERRFWITVIVAALLLNSLLVAGAVVGGFCAAGKCSSSSSASSVSNTGGGGEENGAPPLVPNVTLIPSPSPSRTLSAIPTSIATLPPDSADLVPQTPTRSPSPFIFEDFPTVPTRSPYPTVIAFSQTLSPTRSPAPINFKDTPTSEAGTSSPAGFDTTIASMLPSPTLEPDAGVAVDPTTGRQPSGKDEMIDTLSPSISPTVKPTDNMATKDNDGVSLAVLIPVLVGLEAMIMVGLLAYYRRWKKQKALYCEYDSIQAPEAASTVATDSSNGGAGPTPGCNASRSCNGSSTAALPTIDECESHDHDQYSV